MGVVGSEAAWAPFERCSGAVLGRLDEGQSRTLLGQVKATLCLGTGIGDRQDCRDDVLGIGRRHPFQALQQRRRVNVRRCGPGPDLVGQADELRDAGRAGGTRTDGYVDRTVLLARLKQVSQVAGGKP